MKISNYLHNPSSVCKSKFSSKGTSRRTGRLFKGQARTQFVIPYRLAVSANIKLFSWENGKLQKQKVKFERKKNCMHHKENNHKLK